MVVHAAGVNTAERIVREIAEVCTLKNIPLPVDRGVKSDRNFAPL
ncbi:MAG: hypothetical protein QOI12_5214 [Alphaproteobacteria bacterium]|jgi:hypothetical protein|nr:hypothetical protein [Alphaproteobacteria bacterium]